MGKTTSSKETVFSFTFSRIEKPFILPDKATFEKRIGLQTRAVRNQIARLLNAYHNATFIGEKEVQDQMKNFSPYVVGQSFKRNRKLMEDLGFDMPSPEKLFDAYVTKTFTTPIEVVWRSEEPSREDMEVAAAFRKKTEDYLELFEPWKKGKRSSRRTKTSREMQEASRGEKEGNDDNDKKSLSDEEILQRIRADKAARAARRPS